MNQFYNAEFVLMALAVGGLFAFGKDVAAGLRRLHAYAQTPEGAAALRVWIAVMVALCLVVLIVRP